MSKLDPIFAPWGGNAEQMATDIEQLGVTVRQWRNRGNIPPQYWPTIIEKAKAKGYSLDWQQFIGSQAAA